MYEMIFFPPSNCNTEVDSLKIKQIYKNFQKAGLLIKQGPGEGKSRTRFACTLLHMPKPEILVYAIAYTMDRYEAK